MWWWLLLLLLFFFFWRGGGGGRGEGMGVISVGGSEKRGKRPGGK